MSNAYLNGEFVELSQARISPLDRGFLFGDGVYEVIPVYDGRPFHLKYHLQRLENSQQAIHLNPPLSQDEWQAIIMHLIEKNGGGDLSIYIQISRGAEEYRKHSIPTNCTPTCFAYCRADAKPMIEQLSKGIKVITAPDIRWKRCHIKATSLLANILLLQQATNAHSDETILINDGYAVEGTKSNLFIVKNGTLITTPTGPHILAGSTRDLILTLASKNGIPTLERMIHKDELMTADEVWLSGSISQIKPVLHIDDQPIGNAKAGQMWRKMIHLYHQYINECQNGQ